MGNWNSSPHPISDIRDWSETGRLELRPDFQRREVWSSVARIMLIDTILRGIPMPKIFLASTIRDDRTYRVVIDGQQRISTILDFLKDQFALDDPYNGPENGKKYSELDQNIRDSVLSYKIDFNEAINPSEEEVREVYSRVNKYTVPLNKQELRRADFPGDFLKVCEELAVNPYFDHIGIFTPANRRRYADVEYISEIVAAMIGGIQDKKSSLDDFYRKLAKWEKADKKQIKTQFNNVLDELKIIFNGDLNISKTRFRQKADFYTLFLVVAEFISRNYTVREKDVMPLQEDLKILDHHIRPESEINICSEYAIKCVSQANSASSRRWRYQFLKCIFAGTYIGGKPDVMGAKLFYRIMDAESTGLDSLGMCPDPVFECPVCNQKISGNFQNSLLAWYSNETINQISNASLIHLSCMGLQSKWLVVERPQDDQPDIF